MTGNTYTHGHHESVLRAHKWRTAQNSAAYLLPYLNKNQLLLDVGCGPGTITLDLAARTNAVVAIDTSADIIDQAKQVAKDHNATNVTFEVANVHSLPFADATFDVVHAHQVLQHVHDPVLALQEMKRVTKPGGLVAARDGDYESMIWYPEKPDLLSWLSFYQKLAHSNGGEPNAGRMLLSWALKAGFENIEPSASVWCFATQTDRRWWGELWAERTMYSLKNQGLAKHLVSETELEQYASAWREWQSCEDGWFTVTHGEILARA